MGAFAGFSASAIALVASQVPEQRLGYALGWLSTGQLVGGLVGPVLGGIVADSSGSYRAPFFTTAFICFVALVLAWAFVREDFKPPSRSARKNSTWKSMRLLVQSGSLLALFLVLLLTQFAVRAMQPVVTLFVQQLVGNIPNIATLAGIAFSVTGVADLLASPFLGKRSDIIGYRRVLLICLLGSGLASIPQALLGVFGSSCWSGSQWAASSVVCCRRQTHWSDGRFHASSGGRFMG